MMTMIRGNVGTKWLPRLALLLIGGSAVLAGGLEQLNYSGVAGNRVDHLRNAPQDTVFPGNPDSTVSLNDPQNLLRESIATLESATTNSAALVRGWLEPPQTGYYTFWVTGADDAEFWLSTVPADAAAKERIAFTDGATPASGWFTRLSQRSAAVLLSKGQQYYFELIQKTGGSIGGLAQVGWWLPDGTLQRPIPMRYAQRFATGATVDSEELIPVPRFDLGPAGITAPGTVTVMENQSLDLTPSISANYPVSYQWYENGVAMTVANGFPRDETTSTLFIDEARIAEHDGEVFQLEAGAGNFSDPVTLDVLEDVTPPEVVTVAAAGNCYGFTVYFSENVEPASATNAANYTLSPSMEIDRITMLYESPQGSAVVIDRENFRVPQSISVSGIRDLASSPNTMVPATNLQLSFTHGGLSASYFGALNGGDPVAGNLVADLLAATNRYPNNPNTGGIVTNFSLGYLGSSRNLADHYGARLAGSIVAPETGEYNFTIASDGQAILYLSEDYNPAGKRPVAAEPWRNSWRGYRSTSHRTLDDLDDAGDAFVTSLWPGVAADKAVNQSKNTVGGIMLQAGQKYYVEAIMKEGEGADHLDVTWQLPGTWNSGDNNGLADGQEPISGVHLLLFGLFDTCGDPVVISVSEYQVVTENRGVQLSVAHGGSPPFLYQWYREDGRIVPDGTQRVLTFPRARLEDSGRYRVRVRNLYSESWSDLMELTVVQDTEPPRVVRVAGNADFNKVSVLFDELIDPVTATQPWNFSIKRISNGANLPILGEGRLIAPTNGGFRGVEFYTATQSSGARYTMTLRGVKDVAANPNVIPESTTAGFTGWVMSRGFVRFEKYRTLVNGLDDPLFNEWFPRSPDYVSYRTSFEAPWDNGDYFVGRVSGHVLPEINGVHDFYMSSDGDGELFLSPNDFRANLEKVAFEPVFSARNEWTGTADGRRAEGDNYSHGEPVTDLVVGAPRYLELVYAEQGGADHGAVTWSQPGDATPTNGTPSRLTGDLIGTYANPDDAAFDFVEQPVGGTFAEGERITLRARGTGTVRHPPDFNPRSTYQLTQWQARAPGSAEFTNIVGQTGINYITPWLTPADDGVTYRAMVSIPGLVTPSAEATVNVVVDEEKPVVLAVTGDVPDADGIQRRVKVYFSERMDLQSATNLIHYTIVDPVEGQLLIYDISLSSDETVAILRTAPQQTGRTYHLIVQDVADASQAANTLDFTAVPFSAWERTAGYVKREFYFDIPGRTVADLTNSAKFPSSPDYADLATSIEMPSSRSVFGTDRDLFGTRLSGWLSVDQTDDYLFAISADDQAVFYLSSDEDPANKIAIVSEPEWNGLRSWNTLERRVGMTNNVFFPEVQTLAVNRSQNTTGPVHLVEGEVYYFELLHKDGGGGDNCAVTWWPAGDSMPGAGTPPVSGANSRIYVNPDNRITISRHPESASVEAGEPFELSVAATAYEPAANIIQYQWRRNGVPLAGYDQPILWIGAATAAKAGTYDVVLNAPGAATVISHPAELTVIGPALSISKSDNMVHVRWPESSVTYTLQMTNRLDGSASDWATDAGEVFTNGGFHERIRPVAEGDSTTFWRLKK